MSESKDIYVYGKHPVVEALTKKISTGKGYIDTVLLTKTVEGDTSFMALVHKSGCVYKKVTQEEIDHYVGKGVAHQGVCATIVPQTLYSSLETVLKDNKKERPLLVLLDELEDPHNVGAIIRSSVAFGVDAVLIPEHGQVGVTGTVIKTSAGTVFSVPIVKIGNVNTTLSTLKEKGFWIYGLTGGGSTSLHSVSFDSPTVIVIGNEGRGIREKTLELCDFSLSIPISNACESLNASNAVAVTLYEWNKQQKITS